MLWNLPVGLSSIIGQRSNAHEGLANCGYPIELFAEICRITEFVTPQSFIDKNDDAHVFDSFLNKLGVEHMDAAELKLPVCSRGSFEFISVHFETRISRLELVNAIYDYVFLASSHRQLASDAACSKGNITENIQHAVENMINLSLMSQEIVDNMVVLDNMLKEGDITVKSSESVSQKPRTKSAKAGFTETSIVQSSFARTVESASLHDTLRPSLTMTHFKEWRTTIVPHVEQVLKELINKECSLESVASMIICLSLMIGLLLL
ncbi:MAG: hypothetical protein JKY54_03525 [Flavobacteriales bacterium]|nr:hypothetical protein [Flavobacteriales bacterium]